MTGFAGCSKCGAVFEAVNQFDANVEAEIHEAQCDGEGEERELTPPPVVEPETCDCYKCAEPIYEWDEERGQKVIINNVHGELQACEDCGRPKTEYRDLGRKGVYECWWCDVREAEEFVLEA